jgi:hypothetical protein
MVEARMQRKAYLHRVARQGSRGFAVHGRFMFPPPWGTGMRGFEVLSYLMQVQDLVIIEILSVEKPSAESGWAWADFEMLHRFVDCEANRSELARRLAQHLDGYRTARRGEGLLKAHSWAEPWLYASLPWHIRKDILLAGRTPDDVVPKPLTKTVAAFLEFD